MLVKEAQLCGEATVVLGTSKTHRRIRSSASVAKYCARKLSKYFTVLGVDNGKILFQRVATATNSNKPRGRNLRIYMYFEPRLMFLYCPFQVITNELLSMFCLVFFRWK